MNRTILTIAVVAAVLTGFDSAPTRAAQVSTAVTLSPTKDNTLYEDSSGSRSNGAGDHFFAGRTGEPFDSVRRAAIAFDFGSIPPRARVARVALTLNMSRTQAGPEDVELRKLLADWGEGGSDAPAEEGEGTAADPGDATWLHTFFDTSTWAKPGGDFSDTVSAVVTVGGIGSYAWSSERMVADVQGWVDDPASNFGWLLKGNESQGRTAKRFDSKENASDSSRPTLTVEYVAADAVVGTPVPEATAVPAVAITPTTQPTVAPAAEAGTLVKSSSILAPSKDNTLYEDSTGSRSNGTGQHLFVGRTGQGQGSIRRAVIAFDIAGNVPPETTITGVTLTLNKSRGSTDMHTVSLHALLADWGEGASDAASGEGSGTAAAPGDSTWLHRFFDTAEWAAAGADFAEAPSASTPVADNGKYVWVSDQMAADVQKWLDDPAGNFGWVLVGDEGQPRTVKRFDSKENPDATSRPTLTIEFSAPPTGATTPTSTPTPTAQPTATPTSVPTATPRSEPTATPKPRPTATRIPTATPTSTPVPTASPTVTPPPTATVTPPPTGTLTPAPAATATSLPSPAASPLPTATAMAPAAAAATPASAAALATPPPAPAPSGGFCSVSQGQPISGGLANVLLLFAPVGMVAGYRRLRQRPARDSRSTADL